MADGLEQAKADLENREAGWVTRRDGAEALGKIAREALAALEAHREEPDVDVRMGVERALEALRPPQPMADRPERKYTLPEIVERLAKPGRRSVEPRGSGYTCVVTLKNDREQTVYIEPFERRDGSKFVQIYTYCGEADEKVHAWALRTNRKLPYCAFALRREDDEQRMVVVENVPLKDATPRIVKKAVKEVAFYGDWLEGKLSDEDVF